VTHWNSIRNEAPRGGTFVRASGAARRRAGPDKSSTAKPASEPIISAAAWVAVTIAAVLGTMFCLAYLWEFRLEASVFRFLSLPYDAVRENEDNWRFIWMETAFAAVALILPAIVMARNIGSLKRSLAAVIASQNDAIAANSAKSRFLANMSHELRTPLNAIIGFSELTKEEYFGPLNDRYRDYAADIYQSGVHLLTIINDVLDLSKLEDHHLTFDIKDIDLPSKIASLSRMLEPLCEKAHVKMCVNLGGALPTIRADPIRLKQALLNLLSNAIKFTPSGGQITLSAIPISGFVALTIADTGIGITSENLARVVQPFFQVDSDLNRSRDGTGLGLAITVRLIESMGGRFTLESELGVGTRATVCLPCVHGEMAAAA
jgi:signal transduction histidine kinase